MLSETCFNVLSTAIAGFCLDTWTHWMHDITPQVQKRTANGVHYCLPMCFHRFVPGYVLNHLHCINESKQWVGLTSARCSTFACPPPQPSLLRGAAATVEVAWALVAPCVLPPHPAGLFPPLVERRHHQHRYLQGQLWRRCGAACGYCSSPLSSPPFLHFSATTATETPPSAACLPRPISTCC